MDIDQDLLELRWRLRGWEYNSVFEVVEAEPGQRIASKAGPGRWVVQSRAHAWLFETPRWTLERLLTHPPEGWAVTWPEPTFPLTPYAYASLAWGKRDQHGSWPVIATVRTAPDWPTPSLGVHLNIGRDLVRVAQAYQAAAELALILAEIEL